MSEVTLPDEGIQMSFFQLDDPALEAIRDRIMEVDIDHLTPVEALMKLHEIKATLTGKTNPPRPRRRKNPDRCRQQVKWFPGQAALCRDLFVGQRAVEHVYTRGNEVAVFDGRNHSTLASDAQKHRSEDVAQGLACRS